MADIKQKDKMHSTNDEVKRDDEFQDITNIKDEVYDLVKSLLEKTTEDVFSKEGYERIETPTSTYATGKPYGYGAEEGKYQIRFAGKTKSNIEKQIVLGAKKLESQIDMDYNGRVLVLEYRTTEAGFFRGVDVKSGDKKTYMIKNKINISVKDKEKLKKELKNIFEAAARKELSYLINTKLGVEDKIDAGTASIVENFEKNNIMKKLTLKEIFSEDESLPSDEKNIETVINLNTTPVDEEPSKYLLFDDSELDEATKKYKNLNQDEVRKVFINTMKKKFGTTKMSELTPIEKKDLFITIDNKILSGDEQISEITTTGPAMSGGFKDGAFSGSGGYNTKKAFKPVGELKKEKIHEGKEKDEFENKVLEEKINKFKKTPYLKNRTKNRPKVDRNYNIIKEEKDSFWQTVKIDPNYHPIGMPFVKPNSKEELERTVNGDKDKYKRMGIKKEDDTTKKGRLLKRKFSNESENKKENINKRYIVCEKTNEEYERERWKKLSSFKLYETIENKDFEEDYDVIEENFNYIENPVNEVLETKENITEGFTEEKKVLAEETILVEKPESKFGISYKFYKKDFLNENKMYILDLNSLVFVKNPNSK